MLDGRLLIVDDDPLSIETLANALEERYEIHFALSAGEAEAQLHGELVFDLLLLDVIMPGTDGYSLLRRWQQQDEHPVPPVIFITGLNHESAEMRGLELGALDYITKPVNPATMRARIHNHLQAIRARRQLERMAMSDALTGLANRRHFDQTLARELLRCQRKQQPLSLLLLDIDHFKLFNDCYGHPEGDQCLRTVALALQQALNHPSAMIARIGGEEFACLLPAMDRDEAADRARALLACINQLDISHASSLVADHVTISIGVASLGPQDGDDVARRLFLQADDALYQAKEWGRNRVVCAPAD